MHTKTPNIFPTLPEKPDAAMIARYREDGYLAFLNVLTPEEVKAASDGINELVRKYAFNETLTEHVAGKGKYGDQIKNGRGMLFKSRTSDFHFQVEGTYEARPDRLDELADNIRKFQSYTNELPIYDYIANQHPKLRALLGAVLGEDYRPYSSMALCKPAGGGAEKPWHQDLAYFSSTGSTASPACGSRSTRRSSPTAACTSSPAGISRVRASTNGLASTANSPRMRSISPTRCRSSCRPAA